MPMQRLFLPVLLCLLFAACSQEEPPPVETPAAEETRPADTAIVETEETVIETEAAPEESVPEPPAAEPEAAAEAPPVEAAKQAKETVQWKYSPGRHFTQLTTAQGTIGGPDRIEVAEVFWYGCPHCANFDPLISSWSKKLPEDVRFVRIPVMWNPAHQIHGRMYYTAEALGVLDKLHPAIFRAMHPRPPKQGLSLTREEDIRDFFVEQGVSAEDFDAAFRSFTVEKKVAQAIKLAGPDRGGRYEVTSVPLIVVDGKFKTDGPEIRSFDDMLAVTDELVERERRER